MALQYYSVSPESFTQAIIDQDRVWVRLPVLTTLMNELRVADISDDTGAAAALENVTSMTTASPYQIVDGSTGHNTNIRFSAPSNTGTPVTNATYAALFRDGWQQAFDTLIRTLSSPTTDQPTPPARVDAYYQTLYLMGIMLRNSIGVYNLRTFEQEYSLLWGTPPTLFTALQPTYAPPITLLQSRERAARYRYAASELSHVSAYHIMRSFIYNSLCPHCEDVISLD